MRYILALATLATAQFLGESAYARTIEYRATLTGQSPTISTGSKAHGTASIKVDTVARTVSVSIEVKGLTIDGLWDDLVRAPLGPIHLHQYANGNLADADSAQLAFPLPFGASYRETSQGFRVRTGPLSYEKSVSLLGDAPSFSDFVAALDQGTIVVNIHTDTHHAGEINGAVVRARQS